MNNPLHAIVCVSAMTNAWRALSSSVLQQKLVELQRSAAQQHLSRGVTGLLICGGGYFLEWLEGEEHAVRAALDHLQQQNHHAELRVIHDGESDRVFTHWSLCILSRPDAQDSVGRQIEWLFACEPQHLQHWSPVRMVRSVIKPQQLFRSGQQISRVGLFGASSLWISSLLAYLSSHWERPVVRTRLLHGDGFLSASVLEYLDVDHPFLGPLRWVNYSGSILDNELMPLVVERLSMAVLFETQHDANSALAFNTNCLHHLGHHNSPTPLVAVVGRGSQEHMPAVLQIFGEQGRSLSMLRVSMGDNATLWQALREKLQHNLQASPPQPDSMREENTQTPRVLSLNNPSASVTSTSTSAMAFDDASAPCLSQAGPRADSSWLLDLLAIDAVEAASWHSRLTEPTASVPPTGARCLALRESWGQHLVDWSAILQTQEQVWASHANQTEGEPLEQILVRWTDRLILSFQWPVESGCVLSVVTRSGWINEALLRTQLRERLVLLVPPTQTSV